jgi:iron uptake system component EfeO
VRTRLLVLALLAACTISGCSKPAPDPLAITVKQGSCGAVWHADGGDRTFRITNRDVNTTEVQLTDPATGGVYAEVESLAPNTTRPMHVRLGHGRYAFRCYPNDNDAQTGPTVTVSGGSNAGSAAVRPVSSEDLAGAIKSYDAYVTKGLVTLATDATLLNTAAHHGNRAETERAWLVAHLDYNRLGAAYGTFGDFADKIDGMPDGLAGGVTDPGFTGFHRIEYDLWHGTPIARIVVTTRQLVTDVRGLRKDFPAERVDPNDLPLRAHEILENAVQFQLTGHADEGSGTSLATALANIDGTGAVLDAIAPVLSTRYTGWPAVATWIATAKQALVVARHGTAWTPVTALDPADRQRIDAACGGLMEALAPIAAIGEVRRTQ